MTRLQTIISRLLPKSRFARGAAVLALGTVAAQAIVVLVSPILTRLYTPDDFGILAVFSSILAITSIVVGLRYYLAIPLPKSDKDAVNLLALSFILVVIVSILAGLGVLVGGNIVASKLGAPHLAPYLWLLPCALLLTGVYQTLVYWALRRKTYTPIAKTKLLQGLSQVGIQLISFKFGPLGLLLGQVAGQSAGVTGLARGLRHDQATLKNVRIEVLREVAKAYKDFPLFSTWNALLNTGGRQVPPLILGAFFGTSTVGIYYLAHRVLMGPVTILTESISKAFVADAAESNHSGSLAPLVEGVEGWLIRMTFIPLLILVFGTPSIFVLIFGSDWFDAGIAAQLLIPWLFLLVCTNPVSPVIGVLLKQGTALYFEIALFVARLAALIVGGLIGSFFWSIALFSLASVLFVSAKLLWIHFISGARWALWIRTVGIESVFGLPVALVLGICWMKLNQTAFLVIWLLVLIGFVVRSARIYQKGIVNA